MEWSGAYSCVRQWNMKKPNGHNMKFMRHSRRVCVGAWASRCPLRQPHNSQPVSSSSCSEILRVINSWPDVLEKRPRAFPTITGRGKPFRAAKKMPSPRLNHLIKLSELAIVKPKLGDWESSRRGKRSKRYSELVSSLTGDSKWTRRRQLPNRQIKNSTNHRGTKTNKQLDFNPRNSQTLGKTTRNPRLYNFLYKHLFFISFYIE